MANNMLRPLSLAVALVLLAPSLASAQTWPTKPVTLVAPFQAGGGVDLLARRIGGELRKSSGSRSSSITAPAPTAISGLPPSPSRSRTATRS